MCSVKKIFIDCSYLSEHTELNTGIQRVVRKVVENFQVLSKNQNFEVIPVNISNGKFKEINIEDLYNSYPKNAIAKKSFLLKKIYNRLASAIYSKLPFKSLFVNNKTTMTIDKDDILVLLDSTWYMNIWPTVEMVKNHNAKIIAVIYDLIPITHSQFCDDFLVEVFKKWFYDSLLYVDGYIAISNTVKNDLQIFLKDEFGDDIKQKKFDYFLLGSDFKHNHEHNFPIRENLKKIFKKGDVYLIVCTIEPRKNHKYLLDVFDRLWSSGLEVNLCIIGRIGWKVEEIVDRIQNHKFLGKRLFFWSDLNDEELLYCYKHSKMLLFPSVVEGFGLPIVESFTNHLPVLASDISIHREIGQDRIGYFDINSVDDLTDKIKKIQSEGIDKSLIVDENFRWIDWRQSTQILLEKIEKMDKDITTRCVQQDGKEYKAIYEYSDFTNYHDEEFIRNAYKYILKRDSDDAGSLYYIHLLRSGKNSKSDIVSMIRASKEGRDVGVRILGFKKRFFYLKLKKIPILSNILQSVQFLVFASRYIQRLNQLENLLFLKERKFNDKLDTLSNTTQHKLDNFEKEFNHQINHLVSKEIFYQSQSLQHRIDQFIFDVKIILDKDISAEEKVEEIRVVSQNKNDT